MPPSAPLLLLVLWISDHARAQQQTAQALAPEVVLAPHRATYEMKLSVARPNSGIVEVNGNMVLETVNSCEGWAVKQRIKLTFLRNDGEEFETDSNFTSYESKDGLELRFSVRNAQNDEVDEELRGQADLEGIGGKGRASFTLPEPRSFELPAGTLFPTTHLALIIQHARAGDKSVSYKVFDGARLDGAFQVNAVIGRAPRPAAGTPAVRGDVALLRGKLRGACGLPSSPMAIRARSRSMSWRSICSPTVSPARCCSTTVTSPWTRACSKSKPCRGRNVDIPPPADRHSGGEPRSSSRGPGPAAPSRRLFRLDAREG